MTSPYRRRPPRALRLPPPSASNHPATGPDVPSERASGERHEGPPAVHANIAFRSPAPSWPLVETAARKPSRPYGKTPHHAPWRTGRGSTGVPQQSRGIAGQDLFGAGSKIATHSTCDVTGKMSRQGGSRITPGQEPFSAPPKGPSCARGVERASRPRATCWSVVAGEFMTPAGTAGRLVSTAQWPDRPMSEVVSCRVSSSSAEGRRPGWGERRPRPAGRTRRSSRARARMRRPAGQGGRGCGT